MGRRRAPRRSSAGRWSGERALRQTAAEVLTLPSAAALPADIDLVVAPYTPGGALPEDGGPSWLLMRGAVS